MSVRGKVKHIFSELKGHAPFTLFGAVLGIGFMLLFRSAGEGVSHFLFSVFHPGHVVLSAMVTASMFALHRTRKNFILMLVVGYLGSIGIATLSDVLIPHLGMKVLGLDVPRHGEVFHGERHEHGDDAEQMDEVHSHVHSDANGNGIHFGFIREWYIVNPAAIVGVLIAYFFPRTKSPHAFHVLISTWASSSYLLMSSEGGLTFLTVLGIFTTLFAATWLPCCVSDIVFPLLLVKTNGRMDHSAVGHAHNGLSQEQHSGKAAQ